VVTDINLLLILIRQMTALVRRALAEVCTVSVLLFKIRSELNNLYLFTIRIRPTQFSN